jgi:hypothetical protein
VLQNTMNTLTQSTRRSWPDVTLSLRRRPTCYNRGLHRYQRPNT